MKSKYHWSHHRIDTAVALCPPSVRMVGVCAWAEGSDSGVDRLPVVALAASAGTSYGFREDRGSTPAASGSVVLAEEAGWQHKDSEARFRALVIYPDCPLELVDFLEHVSVCCNVSGRLVACPWPADEDDARLADVEAAVRKEAADKDRARRDTSAA